MSPAPIPKRKKVAPRDGEGRPPDGPAEGQAAGRRGRAGARGRLGRPGRAVRAVAAANVSAAAAAASPICFRAYTLDGGIEALRAPGPVRRRASHVRPRRARRRAARPRVHLAPPRYDPPRRRTHIVDMKSTTHLRRHGAGRADERVTTSRLREERPPSVCRPTAAAPQARLPRPAGHVAAAGRARASSSGAKRGRPSRRSRTRRRSRSGAPESPRPRRRRRRHTTGAATGAGGPHEGDRTAVLSMSPRANPAAPGGPRGAPGPPPVRPRSRSARRPGGAL